MNNIKNRTLSILIIFGFFFFSGLGFGFSQELSLSEYKISNSKFKNIIDSIVNYNEIQLKKNKLFEYDFFYIEIKKDIDKSIVTISRVKKHVIDIDLINGKKIGYMIYRDIEFMISGFDNRLMKRTDFQIKYRIINNMDSDKLTISFNSEFDYWEYQIEDDYLMLIYEPENFRNVNINSN